MRSSLAADRGACRASGRWVAPTYPCAALQVDFSATDRIGDAPAESGGGKPAPEAPAKTAPEKKQPKAAGGGGHHAQAPAAASPAADHHHGAGGGEVHWRKKGWDWDAQGRPCGQLDVRQTWRETMYEKPRGWSGP